MKRVLASLIAGLALVGAAWGEGWVGTAIAADPTGIVILIACLALLGMGLAVWCSYRGEPFRYVRFIAKLCVDLGFLGTIVGFILMVPSLGLEGVGDANQTKQMIGNTLTGMNVALYTTLAGLAASIWLRVTVRIATDG